MPRTTLPKTSSPSPDPVAGVAVTLTAADVTNLNQFPWTGREVVVAQNTDTAAHTITITSVADERGRLGSISNEAIAAGVVRVYGPFSAQGWRQTDGNVYLQADSALVKFGVIVLP